MLNLEVLNSIKLVNVYNNNKIKITDNGHKRRQNIPQIASRTSQKKAEVNVLQGKTEIAGSA